jgi:hypothetical protein
MKATVQLSGVRSAHDQMIALWKVAKPYLEQGQRLQVTLQTETRNGDQNRLLHALLGEIAAHVPWAGSLRDSETWKRLLTAAWLRARGESIEVLPALDGRGIDVVFRPTSKLTKGECAELIDFVQAWAAEHGVEMETA